jgi:hypothetical protein
MGEERTLAKELENHLGKTVFLGVRSSFFFVGPCEEARSDLVLIDRMERAFAAFIGRKIGFAKVDSLNMTRTPIGERPVSEVYVRESGEDGEVVIILEGREFGAFWSRQEYLKGKAAFKQALERAVEAATKAAASKTADASCASPSASPGVATRQGSAPA